MLVKSKIHRIIISISFSLAINPLLCKSQDSEVFDFIDEGQKMEVVRDNNVSKEILSFNSPIDSLKSTASIIRTYGKDGREVSNTYYLDGKVQRSYNYEYSNIYSKVKVCFKSENTNSASCYDLIFSEDEGKVYKNLKNGFTNTVYSLTPFPFNKDKMYCPIIKHFIIKSYISDSTYTNNNLPDFDSLDKSKLIRTFVKEKISYKVSSHNGKMVMNIKSKQWWNKNRKKQSDRYAKVEYDPTHNQFSFFLNKGKKSWILEKVKSFDENELFIGQEIFHHPKGKKLSKNLFLAEDDHYKMDVIRNSEGLAMKIFEYVNDQHVFTTTYQYEYFE